jgi:uncharacterized membrane protein YdjX (TVP38/TMEM64 family)
MRRLLLILALLAVALVLWGRGWTAASAWDELARHSDPVQDRVAAHPVIAAAIYIVAYATATALSVPAGALFTVAGGMLFGAIAGAALALFAATTGATLLFLAARSAVGDTFARRGGPRMQALRTRLQRDGFSYLLAIRLVPLFPFWLVNLAAALCGMRLRAYVAATALGVLPVTAVLAWTGSGLGGVLASGERPDLRIVLSPQVLAPLLALAALSLLPLLWRRRGADA